MSEMTLQERTKKELIGLLLAGIVAIVVRTFFFQPFVIPSGSMYPTLMVGDFLFVNKYQYGYSHTAYPFHIKLHSTRLFPSMPTRGDVVVFNNVNRPEMDYIKRCVGLPGDKIQVRGGILHINGTPVKLKYTGMYTYINHMGRVDTIKRYTETLPNGVTYSILKEHEFGHWRLDNTPEYTVPKDHFFMMGDNRDNSSDSRVMEDVGFVPFNALIGRAEILFFSTDARLFKHPESKWFEFWDLNVTEWIPGIRWPRFFNMIR